jgi:hypothetical protein
MTIKILYETRERGDHPCRADRNVSAEEKTWGF